METLDDLRWGLLRLLRRLGRGLRGLWFNRSLSFRRRSFAVVLVLAAYALIRLVPLPGLPCELSPTKQCPPSDDAIALVPAGAYAYVHVNLDRDSAQFEQAEELAARLPHFDSIAQGTLQALDIGPGLDLQRDLASWVGDEVAFAEVQSGTARPRPLFLAAVGDRQRSEVFLGLIAGAGGRPEQSRYGGTTIRVFGGGLAAAEVGEFLAVGDPSAVRAAIDTDRGRGEALSSSDAADAIRDSLPEDRLADAYVSADGVARLLARRGGLAGQLDTFTDYGASRGIAAALVAHDDGLELKTDSTLDRAKLTAAPGFFTAFPRFAPSLAGEVAPDALMYLGIAAPGDTVRLLLDQANAAAPGLVDAFDRFNRRLRDRGGGDLIRDVLPVLDGEAGFAIAPARPLPYLTFVFDDVDEKRAREEMAKLQGPILAALKPARTGQAPTFGERKIGDVVARSVGLSPTLELAYALFDGKLVVSTNPAGVRQAIAGDDDLAGQGSFRTVTSGTSDGASALVFLNLEGLIRRAEPLGLNEIVGGFRADVAKLKALGLTVSSDEESLQTKLFLEIE
ncbi:MAG: DUF3352 domain-containing protein [Actinomycetota bacterium]